MRKKGENESIKDHQSNMTQFNPRNSNNNITNFSNNKVDQKHAADNINKKKPMTAKPETSNSTRQVDSKKGYSFSIFNFGRSSKNVIDNNTDQSADSLQTNEDVHSFKTKLANEEN